MVFQRWWGVGRCEWVGEGGGEEEEQPVHKEAEQQTLAGEAQLLVRRAAEAGTKLPLEERATGERQVR